MLLLPACHKWHKLLDTLNNFHIDSHSSPWLLAWLKSILKIKELPDGLAICLLNPNLKMYASDYRILTHFCSLMTLYAALEKAQTTSLPLILVMDELGNFDWSMFGPTWPWAQEGPSEKYPAMWPWWVPPQLTKLKVWGSAKRASRGQKMKGQHG